MIWDLMSGPYDLFENIYKYFNIMFLINTSKNFFQTKKLKTEI